MSTENPPQTPDEWFSLSDHRFGTGVLVRIIIHEIIIGQSKPYVGLVTLKQIYTQLLWKFVS